MTARSLPIAPVQSSRVAALETLICQVVDREIGPLIAASTGGLLRAAASLAGEVEPRVAITTGMFIPGAQPPAAETDGPVGAAELAVGLQRAGADVRVVTDAPCESAVATALRAAGQHDGAVPLEVLPLNDASAVDNLATRLCDASLTHFIAVERIGPAADGRCYDMRGGDISDHQAPTHLLYAAGNWIRIGIGDGGNELGMGALPRSLVARTIDHGNRIACSIPCDHLIVSGVSNWGAQALLVALAIVAPHRAKPLLDRLSPRIDHDVLTAMVKFGPAVDGVTGQRAVSVDGVGVAVHAEKLSSMLALNGDRSA